MNKSSSIVKLASALAKAQAEMPVVKMNATNPFLKNKYADLGAVIETSRPILAKHGLAITQQPVSSDGKIGVTSVLIHESGEWLEDTIFIEATDSKGLSSAQNAGVVISYLRRYSWSAILGLYADEDNDGQSSTKEAPKSKAKPDHRAELVKRYQELSDEAAELKLTNIPVLTAEMDEAQITATGIELSKRIKEAKAGK